MAKFANTCYTAVCVANDMKHIHTHAVGDKFDTIHNVCQEYYEKASDQADTLTELAIEFNEPLQNTSNAAALIKYRATNQSMYSYMEAMSVVAAAIECYIEAIEMARSTTDDQSVVSMFDDWLRYWKKERNYKTKARLEE